MRSRRRLWAAIPPVNQDEDALNHETESMTVEIEAAKTSLSRVVTIDEFQQRLVIWYSAPVDDFCSLTLSVSYENEFERKDRAAFQKLTCFNGHQALPQCLQRLMPTLVRDVVKSSQQV